MSIQSLTDGVLKEIKTTILRELSPMGLRFASMLDEREIFDLLSSPAAEWWLDARDAAILNMYSSIDSRFIQPSDVKSAADKCWNSFQESQGKCSVQNMYIKNCTDPYVTDIFLHAAGTIDTAIANVLDDYFLSGDSILIPYNGFDMGPGTCYGIRGTHVAYKINDTGPVGFCVPSRRVFNSKFDAFDPAILQRKAVEAKWHIASTVLKERARVSLTDFTTGMATGVKASFVAKKKDIARMVAPQCSGDLLLQFPMGNMLTAALRDVGIDLSTQPSVNGRLALHGSRETINVMDSRERRYRPCTLDLHSASDLIGIEAIRSTFPEMVFDYMMLSRSGSIRNNSQVQELECMAPMGNAFCFPMQTLFFYAIASAVAHATGTRHKEVYVFGDDIIVDADVYEPLMKFLERVHMIPNQRKSFCYGFFRESCGVEAFKGKDISPLKPRSISGIGGLYAFINSLMEWYGTWRILMPHSVSYRLVGLMDVLVEEENSRILRKRRGNKTLRSLYVVPQAFSGSAGLRVTRTTPARVGSSTSPLRHVLRRLIDVAFDEDYQCETVSFPYLSVKPRTDHVAPNLLKVFHLTALGLKIDNSEVSLDLVGCEVPHIRHLLKRDGATITAQQRRKCYPLSQWDSNPTGKLCASDPIVDLNLINLLSAFGSSKTGD